PLSLSGPSEKIVKVWATTANGVTSGDNYGATAGADYTALNKAAVAIPAGSQAGLILVSTATDQVVEASPEKLSVTIASPENATLGTPVTGSGGITDAGPAPKARLSIGT